MTLLLKDPDAVVDYLIDWGVEYLGEDLLADSVWTVDPDEPNGIAVVGSYFDASTSTANASGGEPGRIYRLVNHVTTVLGREDSRSIVVRVEKR
jgi:hypothetical protein